MEKLGIELPLLITQIVNFTIMLVVLTKLLYKPILKVLDKRRETIAESLKIADKAKVEEEKLAIKKQEILKETRDEARVIIDNSRKDGQHLKDELIAQGKKEVTVLKAKLEKELKDKYVDLVTEASKHTLEIAAAMTKRLLSQILTTTEQHQLIEKQLQQLEKVHGQT